MFLGGTWTSLERAWLWQCYFYGCPHCSPRTCAFFVHDHWKKLLNSCFLCMMTSSNGNIVRVTGRLCVEFTGHLCIPLTKASAAELDAFFDLRLNKRLSEQSWGWRFEMPSRSLRRNCNRLTISMKRVFKPQNDKYRQPPFIEMLPGNPARRMW